MSTPYPNSVQQVAPQLPTLVSPNSQTSIVVLVPVNEELNSLKKENQFLREENLILQKRVDRLQEENQALKKQLEELKTKNESELEQLRKENEILKEENQALKLRLNLVEKDLHDTKQELYMVKKELDESKERALIGQLAVTFEKLVADKVMGLKTPKSYYFKFKEVKKSLTPDQKTKLNDLISKVRFDTEDIINVLSSMKTNRLGVAHPISLDDSGVSIDETTMRNLIAKHAPSIGPDAKERMEEIMLGIIHLNKSFQLLN